MALEVSIRKTFEKFRLEVSFTAEQGVTGLLGASGCGKSMTLKCVAGIVTPDSGRIVLDGRVLYDSERKIDLPPQQRRVGYLFQNYALFPNMTVLQNVAAGVRARGRRLREDRAAGLCAAFHLEGLEGKYPRQLSGGQQQRAALARILASDPQVLLLDEPFSALDSYLRWQVEAELREHLDAFPGCTLFVTHSRDEVYRLCTSACVLDHGRSQPVRPVRDLFAAPATLAACLLTGCKNVSTARPAPEGRVEALDWGAVLTPASPLPDGLTHVGVHAHHLKLVDGPGENRFQGRVVRVVEDLSATVVLLSLPGGGAPLRLELDRSQAPLLAGRDTLWMEVPPDALLLLRQ